jgi:hypothetical protein
MKIWKRIVWWFRALLVPIITICIASPVGADEDTLRDLGATAAPGEIAKWDGEQWRNAHDNIGVGSIETGPGLGLQQTDSKVHLSLLYPPIGSVIAWMKNHPGVDPNLPDGWVECNGQLLSDTNSPLHGVVIPNLNGPVGAGLKGRFLRGHSESGHAEESQNLAHNHQIERKPSDGYHATAVRSSGDPNSFGATRSSGGPEARPHNYSVVWIMRVK